MAFDITNTNRSSSIIRVVDAGTSNIFLANLSSGANETVTAANIRKIAWSTNGNITITRNSVPILALHSTGTIHYDELNHAIANNNTQTMVITITTGGSLVMEVTKEATYANAPGGY
jgi:hypothetical protein